MFPIYVTGWFIVLVLRLKILKLEQNCWNQNWQFHLTKIKTETSFFKAWGFINCAQPHKVTSIAYDICFPIGNSGKEIQLEEIKEYALPDFYPIVIFFPHTDFMLRDPCSNLRFHLQILKVNLLQNLNPSTNQSDKITY